MMRQMGTKDLRIFVSNQTKQNPIKKERRNMSGCTNTRYGESSERFGIRKIKNTHTHIT